MVYVPAVAPVVFQPHVLDDPYSWITDQTVLDGSLRTNWYSYTPLPPWP
jgi:hypothetical protein